VKLQVFCNCGLLILNDDDDDDNNNNNNALYISQIKQTGQTEN
jgi:hypothetical protein